MKDVEIVVFQDKSCVRLKEYQKVKEENELLQQKWLESEYEKSKLVSQIEKMKNCYNCNKYSKEFDSISSMCFGCKNKSKWELDE